MTNSRAVECGRESVCMVVYRDIDFDGVMKYYRVEGDRRPVFRYANKSTKAKLVMVRKQNSNGRVGLLEGEIKMGQMKIVYDAQKYIHKYIHTIHANIHMHILTYRDTYMHTYMNIDVHSTTPVQQTQT